MKCLRIFPEMWASTFRFPGSSTRNIVPGSTCVTVPSVMICSSFATGGTYSPLSFSQAALLLLASLQRDGPKVFAFLFPVPPVACRAPFFLSRKLIFVEDRAHESRRLFRKWVLLEQPEHAL